MQIYYVYILFREDGRPFYVGKGKGNRWLCHEKEARRGRSYKDNIILDMKRRGVIVPKLKVADGISNDLAKAMEVFLIAKIGRLPDGPLTNLTAGGDTGLSDASASTRAKLRAAVLGKKQTPELVAKRMASQRKTFLTRGFKKRGPRSEEAKRKTSEAIKKQWAEGSVIRLGMLGKKHSQDTIKKMRASALGRVISEKQRAAISAAQLGRKASAETRAKMRAAQLARWERVRDGG